MPDPAPRRRLDLAALSTLPAAVARPAYDPTGVTVGVLHLGLGAFHRAHQAVYTDDILAGDLRWGICGVSLKTPRAIEPLAAQDGLYALLTRTSEGTTARVIGALRETIFAGAARAALVARFADPRITVVTATVTEKGYCHDPATGALNEAHPDIAHDLAHPGAPESAIGILVAGLAARRAAFAGKMTFICCDNLPHNGRMVEGLVRTFAQRRDAALAAWIGDHVAFPSTMVDRIVPATTDADIAEAQRQLGVHDAAPVTAEPFGQWIIEDRIAAARPRWEDAGAQFVADVAPFELMKLRLLNGSHSTLAYLGFLMGHEFVWTASRDPLLATLIERQMAEEIVPTLTRPPGHRLARLLRAVARAFPQRGAAAQDPADRDGWLAKTAAAPARDDSRAAFGRRAGSAPDARGRGLDPLRERHRRTRCGDRRAGPAGARVPGNRARCRRRSGAGRGRLSRPRKRVRPRSRRALCVPRRPCGDT